VLAGVDVVMTPERAAVIESTHFFKAEVDEIGVRFGQLESRGARTEPVGQVDDLEIVELQMRKKPLQRLEWRNHLLLFLAGSSLLTFLTSAPPPTQVVFQDLPYNQHSAGFMRVFADLEPTPPLRPRTCSPV
jgi:hypothetical protein